MKNKIHVSTIAFCTPKVPEFDAVFLFFCNVRLTDGTFITASGICNSSRVSIPKQIIEHKCWEHYHCVSDDEDLKAYNGHTIRLVQIFYLPC